MLNYQFDSTFSLKPILLTAIKHSCHSSSYCNSDDFCSAHYHYLLLGPRLVLMLRVYLHHCMTIAIVVIVTMITTVSNDYH